MHQLTATWDTWEGAPTAPFDGYARRQACESIGFGRWLFTICGTTLWGPSVLEPSVLGTIIRQGIWRTVAVSSRLLVELQCIAFSGIHRPD
jgi:hypothetical protein